MNFEEFFKTLVSYKELLENEKEFIQKADKFYYKKIFDAIDELFIYKNKLLEYTSNIREMTFNPDLMILPKNNFQEFFHLCEHLYKPEFSCNKNFFEDIISENSFKELLKYILKSNTLNTYYEKYEIDDENLLQTEDFYNNFLEGINYVPLPKDIQGYTDSTLLIFINSQPRLFSFQFFKQNLGKIVFYF